MTCSSTPWRQVSSPRAYPRLWRVRSLEVEYISLLAQAQQAVAASSLERVMGFAGNLVAVFPDIVDGINSDEALRQYSEILGTSPDVIISDEELQAKRQARAEEQQQMQAMEQASQLAQGAKVLSETDTQNPNAPSFVPNSFDATAFNEGARSIGTALHEQLRSRNPVAYMKMLEENHFDE
jgi:hypothetical protein